MSDAEKNARDAKIADHAARIQAGIPAATVRTLAGYEYVGQVCIAPEPVTARWGQCLCCGEKMAAHRGGQCDICNAALPIALRAAGRIQ